MMADAKLEIGDAAPDFALPGIGRRDYKLSEYLGQPVVLVFYPGDATPVCTMQLKSYSSGIHEFKDLNAVVLGISPQDVDSHEKFAADERLAMPLLYDEGKKVGERYSVLGPLGFYRRSIFVVNSEGKLTFVKRGYTGATFVGTDKLVAAVKAASA